MTDPINFWIAEVIVKVVFTLSVCLTIVGGFVCFSLWTEWQNQRRRIKRQATCTHDIKARAAGDSYCISCGKKL